MVPREIEVDGEKIYLKRDFLGWRIINPNKNPDGSLNWYNVLFGGKRNLAILLFLIVLVGVFIGVYYNDVHTLQQLVEFYKSKCMIVIPQIGN